MDQAAPEYKAFHGASVNAVGTRIWIAITTYLLVAILKKELAIEDSIYIILQVLSVSLFEKTPVSQALSASTDTAQEGPFPNQLALSKQPWDSSDIKFQI